MRATDATQLANPYHKQVRRYIDSNPNNDLESLAYCALKMWPEGISSAYLAVLIVNGANDHPYVDSADFFAAALPNGCHLKIPDTDHMTAVADQRFQQAALEFLLKGVNSKEYNY